jgi:hypothetical protein
MNGSQSGSVFAIKSMVAEKPFDMIGFTSILVIFMGGFSLRIMERKLAVYTG